MRITSATLSESPVASSAQFTTLPEHDIQEVVARFNRPEIRKIEQERSARSIGSILSQKSQISDFNTATQGGVTFRRVDPLRETKVVADERLQQRLENLCQVLRSKY